MCTRCALSRRDLGALSCSAAGLGEGQEKQGGLTGSGELSEARSRVGSSESRTPFQIRSAGTYFPVELRRPRGQLPACWRA